jgi:Ni/Co efflux regulator RcnB
MHRYLSALVLSAALLTPVAVTAAKDDDHHRHKVKRYYDKDSHDWHEWNEREDSAYRRYLQEQQRANRD